MASNITRAAITWTTLPVTWRVPSSSSSRDLPNRSARIPIKTIPRIRNNAPIHSGKLVVSATPNLANKVVSPVSKVSKNKAYAGECRVKKHHESTAHKPKSNCCRWCFEIGELCCISSAKLVPPTLHISNTSHSPINIRYRTSKATVSHEIYFSAGEFKNLLNRVLPCLRRTASVERSSCLVIVLP